MSGEIDSESTLNLMAFDNVRDGGVVETPTSYAMLIRVQPRDWLILSNERRESLYVAFMTFLRGLQFPTQILSMTTAFDPEPYLARFATDDNPVIGPPQGENNDQETASESILMDYGRRFHTEWVREVIDVAEIRDREFYVAVAVRKGETEAKQSKLSGLRSVLSLRSARAVNDEDEYLDEVWTRAQRVASKLPQTQVGAAILDSRPAVLEVLYEVYRGEKPPISFTQGTFTTVTEETRQIGDRNSADNETSDKTDEERKSGVEERAPDGLEIESEPKADSTVRVGEEDPDVEAKPRPDEESELPLDVEDTETAGPANGKGDSESERSNSAPNSRPATESKKEAEPNSPEETQLAVDNDRLLAYLAGEERDDNEEQTARSDPFSLIQKDDEQSTGRP